MAGPRKAGGAREQTGDRQLDAMQERIRRIESAINACPFVSGVLRTVAYAGAGTRKIDHGLGTRAAFIVVRRIYVGVGDPVISEDFSQSGVDLTKSLNVRASTPCVVDLWFYPVASEKVAR